MSSELHKFTVGIETQLVEEILGTGQHSMILAEDLPKYMGSMAIEVISVLSLTTLNRFISHFLLIARSLSKKFPTTLTNLVMFRMSKSHANKRGCSDL